MRRSYHIWMAILLLTQVGCFYNEEVPDDQNVWSVAHPETVGMNANRLLEMNAALINNPNEGINSIVIIKDGNLVFENYYFDNDRSTRFELGGVSSCISNLALGKAIEMGLIESVNDSLYKYLPDYAQEFEDFPLKKNITFAQLMTMKSGLSWNELIGVFDGVDNDVDLIQQSNDWVEYVITKPLDAFPGSRFSFNSAIAVLIAAAIENEYGDTYERFLIHEVYQHLNIKTAEMANSGGNLNPAWGISMTSLDLAKIGYFYLHQGDWFGEQLLDTDYIVSSTGTQTVVDYYNDYGWLWWRYAEGSDFLSLSTNDTFFAAGNEGQRLYVVPHLDLVVVMTGSETPADFSLFSPFVLRDYIIDAIQ